MGIWGFVLLIINYFSQIHFGVGNSLNVLLVQHKEEKQVCDSYIVNSMTITAGMSILVMLLYLYYEIFGVAAFERYNIDPYVIWIALIAILQYFNMLFSNIFRIRNMIY